MTIIFRLPALGVQDFAGDWLDESISWVWSRLSELLKTLDNPAGLVQEVEQFLKPHVDDLEGIAFGIVFDRNKPSPPIAHRQAVQRTLVKRKDSAWSRLLVDADLLEAKLEKAKRKRKRPIIIALISAVAVVVAAIIGNWEEIFQGAETQPIVKPEAGVVEVDTANTAFVDLDSTAIAESDSTALE